MDQHPRDFPVGGVRDPSKDLCERFIPAADRFQVSTVKVRKPYLLGFIRSGIGP